MTLSQLYTCLLGTTKTIIITAAMLFVINVVFNNFLLDPDKGILNATLPAKDAESTPLSQTSAFYFQHLLATITNIQ